MKPSIKNRQEERRGNDQRMRVRRTKRELESLGRHFDAGALLDAVAGFVAPMAKR
jgi:hypothetical protein